jgi:hypothetical protein
MKKSSEPPLPEPAFTLHDRANDMAGLDLPDAPDFISRRTILPLGQALGLLEERRHLFSNQRGTGRLPRRQPVPVEFVI